MDDPLLVELQAEDYWYEAYNMRTGARGVFPAYYAIEVTKEPEHMAGSTSLQFGPTHPCMYPPNLSASEHAPQVSANQAGEQRSFQFLLQHGRPSQVAPRCLSDSSGFLSLLGLALSPMLRVLLLYGCFPALAKNSDWTDQFRVKFLGSVQVPYHKGNDVLCAAMQKVPKSDSLPFPGDASPQPAPTTGEKDTGLEAVL